MFCVHVLPFCMLEALPGGVSPIVLCLCWLSKANFRLCPWRPWSMLTALKTTLKRLAGHRVNSSIKTGHWSNSDSQPALIWYPKLGIADACWPCSMMVAWKIWKLQRHIWLWARSELCHRSYDLHSISSNCYGKMPLTVRKMSQWSLNSPYCEPVKTA